MKARTFTWFMLFLASLPILAQEAGKPSTAARFQMVDVSVDSKDKPLAAYQLEVTFSSGTGKIVGIEGGEHPAFKQPPFYDPKAIQAERVILAAFNTSAADQLPRGRTRVASLHVQTLGSKEPVYAVKLTTAATVNGKKIPVTATIEERKRL